MKKLLLFMALILGCFTAFYEIKAQDTGTETTIELCPGSGETCAEGDIEVQGVKIKLVKAKGAVGAKVVVKQK